MMKLPYQKTQRKAISQWAGAGIARARVQAGLTQDDVAHALDIGIEAVSRLERGVVDPGVSRLAELSELFDCDLTELLAPSSVRPIDQAIAISQEISTLPVEDRDAVVEMVRQLVQLLGRKPKPKPKRQTDKG